MKCGRSLFNTHKTSFTPPSYIFPVRFFLKNRPTKKINLLNYSSFISSGCCYYCFGSYFPHSSHLLFSLNAKSSRDTVILYFPELKQGALFYCTFIPAVPRKKLCVIRAHAAHFDSQSVNSLCPPVSLPLPQAALINYSGNISSENKRQIIELCCKGGKETADIKQVDYDQF